MNKELNNALTFDPLYMAEQVTGESYKEDKGTEALGFFLMQANAERKKALLTANADTHWSTGFDEGMAVFADMGFEILTSETYDARFRPTDDPQIETYNIMWHPDGILATANSYWEGKTMDGAKIFYNVVFDAEKFDHVYEFDLDERGYEIWETKRLVKAAPGERGHYMADGTSRHQFTSSGGYYDYDGQRVWVGDHDAREGLRHAIEGLRSVGEFLPVWRDQPFLWLLTSEDSKVDGYDHNAITAERVSRLPQHVQDAIRGDEVKVPM